MKYTIKNLKNDFPNDDACLDFIFKNRWPKGLTCPNCEKKDFYHVKGRKSYACKCGYQVSPTEGTIFHKSSTPLTLWFHAIFLMSQSKNGVAAKELERQLGVTYKCAWRMARQIRLLMSDDDGPLGDNEIVELDETYVGGKAKGKRGRGAAKKTPVFGAVERNGKLKTKVVLNVRKLTLMPLIKDMVADNSVIVTDESNSYNDVKKVGHLHESINHSKGQYVDGDVHTNTIEGFWSQFKRSVHGTYHSVSRKHLQLYLDEFSFRYSHRKSDNALPVLIFSKVGQTFSKAS
jgi:transposase-like protein